MGLVSAPTLSKQHLHSRPPPQCTEQQMGAELRILPCPSAAAQPRAGLWQTPAQDWWPHMRCCRSCTPRLGGAKPEGPDLS